MAERPWLTDPAAAFASLPAALRARICRCSPRATACWLWLGPLSYQGKAGDVATGYGRQSWPIVIDNPSTSKTNWLAHKLIWTFIEGPVDPELVLDHLKDRCTARRCVRPDHLEAVTHAENTRRGGGRFGNKRFREVPRRQAAPVFDDEDEVPF